jgi:hypothetical protein
MFSTGDFLSHDFNASSETISELEIFGNIIAKLGLLSMMAVSRKRLFELGV